MSIPKDGIRFVLEQIEDGRWICRRFRLTRIGLSSERWTLVNSATDETQELALERCRDFILKDGSVGCPAVYDRLWKEQNWAIEKAIGHPHPGKDGVPILATTEAVP